ncbi:hypothetical protein B296_00011409 [Ensete ventricosum]|uniref:Uncharacterized protein n=1 Tax=Ensete ventricosum TaxID=4639 RepID=A0A427AN06_ENSVE|nr:hypothetical protein B296_00011409 [Ensete ventricosum]
MAAAEARHAWQRTLNRCLVQEDAKRAPKLACCPSSTPQTDSSNGNAASTHDCPVANFIPLNRNHMNPNLSPETKWWLQIQPNYGYHKDFICEQLSFSGEEVDEKDTKITIPTSKMDGDSSPFDSINLVLKNEESSMESPWMVSTAFMKRGPETSVKEMNIMASSSQHPLKRKTDMYDYLYKEEQLLDLKLVDRLISKRLEKDSLDLETPWAGINKSEPWWRIADKDELASLVAQKSLQHIENCDLPKPTQTVHVAMDPFSTPDDLNTCGRLQSSFSGNINAGICNANEYIDNTSFYGSSDNKNLSSGKGDHMGIDSDTMYRQVTVQLVLCFYHSAGLCDFIPSENDRARAQLLDALRHSQTRARKAEMAAQKAYNEKEHIVKLLFREASHLFAYKQWLLMLQLENLCLQLKIKDHQLSTLVPVLPWMPLKEKLFSKDKITRRQVMKKQNCELKSFELQEVLGKGIQALRLCEEMISKLGLLSSNETKVDVNAANLKSLLVSVPFRYMT